MNAVTDSVGSSSPRGSAPLAVLAGGTLSGAIDLTYACTYHGLRGIPPIRILQSIASGLFGTQAFEGGAAAAALGFAAHFFILTGAAAMYYAASRRLPALTRQWLPYGVAFGLAIYATMHLVILPLSAAPAFKGTLVGKISDFSVHLALLGPAIAYCIKRFGKPVAG